jgi:hypothetical protein
LQINVSIPSGESINIEGLDLLLEKVDKALKT